MKSITAGKRPYLSYTIGLNSGYGRSPELFSTFGKRSLLLENAIKDILSIAS